jgi:hypothetical protein
METGWPRDLRWEDKAIWRVVVEDWPFCAEVLDENSEVPGRTRYKALGKDWYEWFDEQRPAGQLGSRECEAKLSLLSTAPLPKDDEVR